MVVQRQCNVNLSCLHNRKLSNIWSHILIAIPFYSQHMAALPNVHLFHFILPCLHFRSIVINLKRYCMFDWLCILTLHFLSQQPSIGDCVWRKICTSQQSAVLTDGILNTLLTDMRPLSPLKDRWRRNTKIRSRMFHWYIDKCSCWSLRFHVFLYIDSAATKCYFYFFVFSVAYLISYVSWQQLLYKDSRVN